MRKSRVLLIAFVAILLAAGPACGRGDASRDDPAAALSELVRGLWTAQRRPELRRVLATSTLRVPGSVRDAADEPFFAGDRFAGFRAYADRRAPVLERARSAARAGRWSEAARLLSDPASLISPANPKDIFVTAWLLEGDALAACGRYEAARIAWDQALTGSARQPEVLPYHPEWTSALRRLLRYEHAADAPRAGPGCRPPVATVARVVSGIEVDASTRAWSGRLENAWQRLARGEAREALATFEGADAFWQRFMTNGDGAVDSARGVVLAALYAREDARAERALRRVFAPAAGRNADPVVAARARRALAGDLHLAIETGTQPSREGGGLANDDEQLAAIGQAHALRGDWKRAEEAWLAAARAERVVPEWQPFWNGNLTALAMLVHYRGHFARGERRYRWRLVPSREAGARLRAR